MCNGNNHPPGCPCDFRGGNNQSSFEIIYQPSFLNPNANCPKCGAPVYYYQSRNGGRVFFDDIWPDWPKHPCTDNYIRSKTAYIKTNSKVNIELQQVFKTHSPLILDDIGYIGIGYTLNAFVINNANNEFKLKNHQIAYFEKDKYAFYYYRLLSPISYELVCVKLNGNFSKIEGEIKYFYEKGEKLRLKYSGKSEGEIYYFDELIGYNGKKFYILKKDLTDQSLIKIQRNELNLELNTEIVFKKDDKIKVREI